jgi:hypothetical protein
MAIGLITRFPEGAGAAEYDAVQEKLDLDNVKPDGLILHCAGEVDGGFQVFDIWESRENHDAFRDGALKDAMIAAMGQETYDQMPEAERTETTIHNYVIP